LIFGLIFVSRVFEVGRNVSCEELTVSPVYTGLIFSNVNRPRGAYSARLTRAPENSKRRGQRTFPSEYQEDGHTCDDTLSLCRETLWLMFSKVTRQAYDASSF